MLYSIPANLVTVESMGILGVTSFVTHSVTWNTLYI